MADSAAMSKKEQNGSTTKSQISNENPSEKKTINKQIANLRQKYLIARKKRQSNLNYKGTLSQPRRRPVYVKTIHMVRNGIDISFNMTEHEREMLQFYQVKLSILKNENMALHDQLASLAAENLSLLQMETTQEPMV